MRDAKLEKNRSQVISRLSATYDGVKYYDLYPTTAHPQRKLKKGLFGVNFPEIDLDFDELCCFLAKVILMCEYPEIIEQREGELGEL